MKGELVHTPTALITGASSGIGRELAREFALNGFSLVLSARGLPELEALAAELRTAHQTEAHVIAADLSTASGAFDLVDAIHARGLHVTHLINNAGYGLFGEFVSSNLDDEQRMMTLNMVSPMVLCKRLLPTILQARGKIMNVASTAAFQPGPYMAVYYASKAFVLSFSEALAEELTDTGVTVTALCPGPTASGFQHRAAMHDSALVKGKQLPTSAEVAQAAFKAMQRGQRVYIPGVVNWLFAQSIRFTPRRLVTFLVRRLSAPKP